MTSRSRSVQRLAQPARQRRRARQTAGTPARNVDVAELAGLGGFLLRRAQLWTFADFIRTLAPLEIRPAQFSVLSVINANPGLSQIALAQALGIERAAFVRLLDGLEGRGYLSRIPSLSDRRSHALYLTREGQSALSRMRALVLRHERHLIAKLGPARHKALLRALAVFADL